MTYENFIKYIIDNNLEYIYGYMYGKKYTKSYDQKNERCYDSLDKIIKINIKNLTFSCDNKSFYFIWGYPGPDFTKYYFEDYCKTWGFYENDLESE